MLNVCELSAPITNLFLSFVCLSLFFGSLDFQNEVQPFQHPTVYLHLCLPSFFWHFDNLGPLHESHYQLTSGFCFNYLKMTFCSSLPSLETTISERLPWTDNSQAVYKRPVAISPTHPCTVATIGWWSASNLLLLLTKLICHYWMPGSVIDMHLIFTKSRGQLIFFT